LDIFLIGSGPAERMDRFERFAREQGCAVRRGMPEKGAIDPGRGGSALVFFGDGEPPSRREMEEAREEFRYLGVSLVIGDPDKADASLLEEIRALCDTRAVPPAVREGFLEPFLSAACLTLREWATTDAFPRAVYRKPTRTALGELTAVLRLVSPRGGLLALNFPDRTARTLTARVLARSPEALEEEIVRDCMREMVNVVAGQAKALLLGTPHHFDLSIPRVVVGAGADVGAEPDASSLIAAFDSDGGDFALQLFVRS
jgi:chemotaxis protein CheX